MQKIIIKGAREHNYFITNLFKNMEKTNLSESLRKLEKIVEWFEEQSEVDVEKGLEKVKEGARLIKISKERLKKVENEFEEVKRGLGGGDAE